MSKPAAKTTLYRLIEAGHLARQQMLLPLLERGLEPGDDAILLALEEPAGVAESELRDMTGLNQIALEMRLIRLQDQGILVRGPIRPRHSAGATLTAKGRDVAAILQASWSELDNALLGELDGKDKKSLRKILKRFVALLSL